MVISAPMLSASAPVTMMTAEQARSERGTMEPSASTTVMANGGSANRNARPWMTNGSLRWMRE